MEFLKGEKEKKAVSLQEALSSSKPSRRGRQKQDADVSASEDPIVGEPVKDITFDAYLKAGYSLLYIRTEEDHRAVQLVKESINKIESMRNSIRYGEWRSTTGLRLAPERSLEIPTVGDPIVEDLASAIQYAGNQQNAHLIVFHNVRQLLQNSFIVIQSLKDASYKARLSGTHLILVGAHLDIPPELQNTITVYDLDLPNADKFKTNFKVLSDAYKTSITTPTTDRHIEMSAKSAVGMTEMQGENAIALSIVLRKKVDPAVVQVEKEQAIKRSDVLEFIHVKESMDDLGGFSELKSWISKRKDAFTPEATEFGLRFPKGILLVGVPGCGKSLAARCVSHYLELPLLKFDIGKVFRSLVGSSEQTVRSALKTAEAVAPVVLWIEEIEKSMAGTQSSGSTDSGTTARVMSTILTWMQENKKPVFIVATANNVESLPPELLRKGRFSEIWGVVEPDPVERADIWRIHLRKVRPERVEDFDYSRLVAVSANFTGAEIESAVEEAMFDAWEASRDLTTEDLVTAVAKFVPQADTCKERIDVIRNWMQQKVRFVAHSKVKQKEDETSQSWRKIRAAAEQSTKPEAAVDSAVEKGEPKKGLH